MRGWVRRRSGGSARLSQKLVTVDVAVCVQWQLEHCLRRVVALGPLALKQSLDNMAQCRASLRPHNMNRLGRPRVENPAQDLAARLAERLPADQQLIQDHADREQITLQIVLATLPLFGAPVAMHLADPDSERCGERERSPLSDNNITRDESRGSTPRTIIGPVEQAKKLTRNIHGHTHLHGPRATKLDQPHTAALPARTSARKLNLGYRVLNALVFANFFLFHHRRNVSTGTPSTPTVLRKEP